MEPLERTTIPWAHLPRAARAAAGVARRELLFGAVACVLLTPVLGRLLSVKIDRNRSIHLGQSRGWSFCLDLFGTAPVKKGIDNSSVRNSVPSQGESRIRRIRIWKCHREYFDQRTMPNTMPGFCIEVLRL